MYACMHTMNACMRGCVYACMHMYVYIYMCVCMITYDYSEVQLLTPDTTWSCAVWVNDPTFAVRSARFQSLVGCSQAQPSAKCNDICAKAHSHVFVWPYMCFPSRSDMLRLCRDSLPRSVQNFSKEWLWGKHRKTIGESSSGSRVGDCIKQTVKEITLTGYGYVL